MAIPFIWEEQARYHLLALRDCLVLETGYSGSAAPGRIDCAIRQALKSPMKRFVLRGGGPGALCRRVARGVKIAVEGFRVGGERPNMPPRWDSARLGRALPPLLFACRALLRVSQTVRGGPAAAAPAAALPPLPAGW